MIIFLTDESYNGRRNIQGFVNLAILTFLFPGVLQFPKFRLNNICGFFRAFGKHRVLSPGLFKPPGQHKNRLPTLTHITIAKRHTGPDIGHGPVFAPSTVMLSH